MGQGDGRDLAIHLRDWFASAETRGGNRGIGARSSTVERQDVPGHVIAQDALNRIRQPIAALAIRHDGHAVALLGFRNRSQC